MVGDIYSCINTHTHTKNRVSGKERRGDTRERGGGEEIWISSCSSQTLIEITFLLIFFCSLSSFFLMSRSFFFFNLLLFCLHTEISISRMGIRLHGVRSSSCLHSLQPMWRPICILRVVIFFSPLDCEKTTRFCSPYSFARGAIIVLPPVWWTNFDAFLPF